MYHTTSSTKTLIDWTREEGLANVQVAEYVEIPERLVIESGGADAERFGDRVIRQIIEAKVQHCARYCETLC